MCSTRHLLLCGLAILSLLTTGCDQSDYLILAGLPTATPTTPRGMVVETQAYTASDQCTISVTVQAQSYDLRLNIEILTEPGVTLLDSSPLVATLMPYDSRTFTRACVLEKHQIDFSGAYVVRAYAQHHGSDQEYGHAESALYVMAPLAEAPYFLGTEQEYKEQFARNYVQGKSNLHYFLAFDYAQPDQGRIYIKVVGAEEGVGPLLNIEMSQGMHLLPGNGQTASLQTLADSEISARLPAIPLGGERIVVLPFRVEASTPGTYHLRVTTHHSEQLVAEVAPLYIRVPEGPGGGQPSPPIVEKMEPRFVTPDSALPALPEAWHQASAGLAPAGAPQIQQAGVAGDPQWNYALTGFAGTRQQLYTCYLLRSQITMDWYTFAEKVVEQNEQLRADNFVFQRSTTYRLPVPVQLEPEPTECLARLRTE